MEVKEESKMKVRPFAKPDLDNMTWAQVFEVYNDNFEALYQTLSSLGANYVVESFSGLTSRVIKLENEYPTRSNALMVYRDNSPQWLGESYKEVDPSHIELLFDPDEADVYKVIILESFSITDYIKPYLDEINAKMKSLPSYYKTVADMVADVTLEIDRVCVTLGEVQVMDSRGKTYLVTSDDTTIEGNYTQLSNGLYALEII